MAAPYDVLFSQVPFECWFIFAPKNAASLNSFQAEAVRWVMKDRADKPESNKWPRPSNTRPHAAVPLNVGRVSFFVGTIEWIMAYPEMTDKEKGTKEMRWWVTIQRRRPRPAPSAVTYRGPPSLSPTPSSAYSRAPTPNSSISAQSRSSSVAAGNYGRDDASMMSVGSSRPAMSLVAPSVGSGSDVSRASSESVESLPPDQADSTEDIEYKLAALRPSRNKAIGTYLINGTHQRSRTDPSAEQDFFQYVGEADNLAGRAEEHDDFSFRRMAAARDTPDGAAMVKAIQQAMRRLYARLMEAYWQLVLTRSLSLDKRVSAACHLDMFARVGSKSGLSLRDMGAKRCLSRDDGDEIVCRQCLSLFEHMGVAVVNTSSDGYDSVPPALTSQTARELRQAILGM